MDQTRSEARPRRILLAEDDPDLREALADALRASGHSVTEVANGAEALREMRIAHPDVIVLDLMMPVLDGWQFRVEQRRDPELAKTPVVAISASRSATASAVDADLYLQKPFDAAMLVRTIEVVLGAQERRQQPADAAIHQRLDTLREIAAGFVHEINNPLTYLLLHLRRAARVLEPLQSGKDGRTVAEALIHLDGAIHGAERIERLTSRVRTLARAGDGGLATIDLRRVADDCLALMPALARHAHLERSYDEVPLVLANEGAVAQILACLLTNAVQAIPPGHPSEHSIRVSTATDERGWAVVEISDTGAGIPKELLGRVFEPFFSTRSPEEASGLGLTICLGLVRSLEGDIRIASEPGRGTKLSVLLPPAEERLAKRNGSAHAAAHV